MELPSWIPDAGAVFRLAYENDVKYPAAALAYYAFLSLVPLLLLGFAAFGRRFTAGVEATMTLYLTPDARELFVDALASVSGRTWASLLSIAVLVWAGANAAVAFLTVMNRVEGVVEKRWQDRLWGGVTVAGSLGAAALAIVATIVVSLALINGAFVDGLVTVVLFVALTVVFLPMYYVPSETVTGPRSALPGAIVAAAGWSVIHVVLQVYVRQAPQYAVYGTLSGVIIVLTGLYVAALLLMIGIVVNWSYAVSGDRHTDRSDTGTCRSRNHDSDG